tara:strand:- start:560408 stop:560923 length:516 start_codon:yes stop_codon:yes gene_type:complete
MQTNSSAVALTGNAMPLNQIVEATEFLVFGLGCEEYAVNVERVQELRGYEHVTRIANVPDYIKGVINLRGAIVPIIDMRIRFGDGCPTYDAFTVVIILDLGKSKAGMVVDSVSDVLRLTSAQIKPAPQVGASMDADYLLGIGALDDRMLILIDVDQMISSADIGLIEKMAI